MTTGDNPDICRADAGKSLNIQCGLWINWHPLPVLQPPLMAFPARRYLKRVAPLIVGCGVYGLLVGGLLPVYIQRVLLPEWARQNHWDITLESLHIDPFDPGIRLHAATIRTADGKPLISLGEAHLTVNWLESLTNRAITLEASVTGVSARIEYGPAGLRGFSGGKKQDASTSQTRYPVVVRQLLIEATELDWRDETGSVPFERQIRPLALRLENLDLRGSSPAHYEASLLTGQNERLQTQGTLTPFPLKLQGVMTVGHLQWADWGKHLASWPGYGWQGGKIDLKLDYRLDADKALRLDLSLDGTATKPALTGPDGQSLAMERLTVEGGHYVYPEHRLSIRQITALNLQHTGSAQAKGTALPADTLASLRVHQLDLEPAQSALHIEVVESDHAVLHPGLDHAGRFHLSGWYPVSTDETPTPTVSAHRSGKSSIRLDELKLSDYDLIFQDDRQKQPVVIPVNGLSLHLQNFDTQATTPVKLDLATRVGGQGQLKLLGQLTPAPTGLEARLDLDGISLKPFQAYWEDTVGFDVLSGLVSARGDLTLQPEQNRAGFSGELEVTRFKTIDKLEKKDFADWESLRLAGIRLDTGARRASVRTVTFSKPHARVVIDQAGSLNLARQFLREEASQETPPRPTTQPAPASPWHFVIGSLHIVEGSMNFSDLTLEPRFTSEIRSLNGNLSSLSAQTRAEINLTGHFNNEAPVRISGQINPFDRDNFTDITLGFKSVNLTTLSPYSSKFAGYRIEKGKLDLDLHYQVSRRKLKAENRMILNQLVLGEQVDSPEATRLPIRWALALLQDADGKIDVSLPITGRLDDPQFSVRHLLHEAFTQTVTKLVSSPFAVLGKLVHWQGHEELGWIGFEAGDARLEQPALDKLDHIARILQQRPQLDLDIKSQANWHGDRRILAEQAFKDHLENMLKTERKVLYSGEIKPETPDYRRLVTVFFGENYPESPDIKNLTSSGQATLEGPRLQAAVERILTDWPVDETDLRLLAQRRSEAIRQYLVGHQGIPDTRLYVLDVSVDAEKSGDTPSLLSLSAVS